MSQQPKFKLKDGHQVELVNFPNDDNQYYEFQDANMAPCHRMYSAMQYYNELKMRCDREFLIAHCEAVNACLNGQGEKKGVVDLVKVAQLTTQLQERVSFILEPETIYKYASVVIFDESEDPYDYNMKYNIEVKIPRWKKAGLSSFFLSEPVKRLFPALNLSEEDLDTYLKVEKEIDKAQLESIFTTLSKGGQTENLSSIAESLKQRILALEK